MRLLRSSLLGFAFLAAASSTAMGAYRIEVLNRSASPGVEQDRRGWEAWEALAATEAGRAPGRPCAVSGCSMLALEWVGLRGYDARATAWIDLVDRASGEVWRGRFSFPELAGDGRFARTGVSRPVASPAELRAAAAALAADSRWSDRLRAQRLTLFPPMPSALVDERTGRRLVWVGLRASGAGTEEIIGVDPVTGLVTRYAAKAPPGACVGRHECGFDDAGQLPSGRGLEGWATLRVMDGQYELWRFTVVRPSISSGAMGSGVELRDVSFRGKPLFLRVHTPITNVQYENNACGPYRDWDYDESPFAVAGTDVAPGIRMASAPPGTVHETGIDRGNFRGVSVRQDPATGEIRVVSELAAGWYRYLTDYRMRPDGTFLPRFAFTAVKDACTCKAHRHHTYWRFELAVGGRGNQRALVGDWHNPAPVVAEMRTTRAQPLHRYWRFRNEKSGEQVMVLPGNEDGVADAYARGDSWILNPRAGEISDNHTSIGMNTEADLDPFVDEAELSTDSLVYWYAAHFLHDEPAGRSERDVHIVGPAWVVQQW